MLDFLPNYAILVGKGVLVMRVWNEYATEYRAKRDELLSELKAKYRAAEELRCRVENLQ